MTAATRFAVFNATESKILHRKVVPDDDAQLERLVVPSGESVLWIPLDLPYDDIHPRGRLIASDNAQPGDRFRSGRFVTAFGTATNSAITVIATVSGALSK